MTDWIRWGPQKYDEIRSGHYFEKRQLLIEKELKNGEIINILEIGCGTAAILSSIASRYPEKKFKAIDVNEEFIRHAREKKINHNLSFECVSVEKIASAEKYDFILSMDLLHHLQSIDVVMGIISAHLKKGGRWLIIEPNCFNPVVFYQQLKNGGEKNFNPFNFAKKYKIYNFKKVYKKHIHLLPVSFKRPSNFLKQIESLFEQYIGGSVVYILEKT